MNQECLPGALCFELSCKRNQEVPQSDLGGFLSKSTHITALWKFPRIISTYSVVPHQVVREGPQEPTNAHVHIQLTAVSSRGKEVGMTHWFY